MSIADKISQLQSAKDNIAAAIIAMGGTVEPGAGFSSFAADIEAIPTGGDLDEFISGASSEVTSNLELIPDFAFSAKSNLETVNIPEAIYIGKYAFSSAAINAGASGSGSGSSAEEGSEGEGEGSDIEFNNNKLVTVNMPKVTNIETGAFQGDENLEVTSLPATLLVIQDKAFKDCPKVQLTAFPENLTYLGDSALDAQENLDIDTMPATLMYLGAGVTSGQIHDYLSQYVDSETGILDLSQVPAQWFQMEISNNILHGEGRFSGINLGTTIEIPSGILVLADNLFYNIVSEVTSISLPEGILSLGNDAFAFCNALTTLTLPNTLTSLGDYAFQDCHALTTLDLSNTQLTSIGDSAFVGCQALTTLTLPNTLTSIGDSAFVGCNALTTIDMTAFDGTSIPQLGTDVFYAETHAEGFKFVFSSQEALDAFAAATNWSAYAQYFEVVSE